MKTLKTFLCGCMALSLWINLTYPSAIFFGEVQYPRHA